MYQTSATIVKQFPFLITFTSDKRQTLNLHRQLKIPFGIRKKTIVMKIKDVIDNLNSTK